MRLFGNKAQVIICKDFKDDYFLNRFVFLDSQILHRYCEKDFCKLLDKLHRIEKKYEIDLYIHIDETDRVIEEIFHKNGLFVIDKVNGMIYDHNILRNVKKEVQRQIKGSLPKNSESHYKLNYVTNETDYLIWTDTYRKSFDIEAKFSKEILKHICDRRFVEARFIICQSNACTIETEHVISKGCCLFYRTRSTIGIYCLGTIKSYRGSGVASTLIQGAINYSRQLGLAPVCAQTLKSDNLELFYEKNGFKKVYTNCIYKIPIHR